MINKASFLFKGDAALTIKLLVPLHATKATIHKDISGWWLLVEWNCGNTAPLTIQELNQAEDISNVESPRVP